MIIKIRKLFSRPEDISSLIFVRIGFGLLMFWEMSRYFYYNWIKNLYVIQKFHFKYEWFQWIEPFSENLLYFIFYLLLISSLMIAIGLFYKLSITVFFFLYLYIFLIDASYYNNHFYAILIISFIMFFLPLNSAWSLDNFFFKKIHSYQIPLIWLWIMRTPMTIIYVYGAFSKMHTDWLNGMAPSELFGKATENTFIEGIFELPLVPLFYGWSGMLFDLLIPFLILWKRTRKVSFIIAIFFHIHNFFIFQIGVFPPLSILLTTLYLNPNFPKKIIPFFLKNYIKSIYFSTKIKSSSFSKIIPNKLVLFTLGIFFFFQIILPFRHYLYPGFTLWHEEGHYFAWRMMLRQKKIKMRFDITNPKTKETRFAVIYNHLNPSQIMSFGGNPKLILQFVHYLKNLVEKNANFTPIITAKILVSLNGRPFKKMVSTKLDLAKLPEFYPAYKWIEKF